MAAVTAATRDVARAPHVTRVLSHVLAPNQVSADARTAYDIVFLDLPPDDSPDAIPGVTALLHEAPGIRVQVAGGPAFYGDVQAVTERDLQRSELISLPLAALALLLVFGSLVAAGVPLAVGGASVLVALAGIFLVASVIPMSIFVLNLATLLGLGLGVDYSLLMTSRFREELAHRDGPDRVAEAVRVTVATAGRAVFFSGLTVLLGLLGLVLFEFMILRSVGIAGAIVVGLAVLAAITLLPAILAILGTRVDRLRDPVDHRRAVAGRAVGTPRPARDAPPGRGPRADAHAAARPRAAVPQRPVQRAGRLDPPARRPVARGVRRPRARVRGGRVRAARASRSARPATATSPDNLASLYAYSRRLAADPRVSSASRRWSTSIRASRWTSTSSSTGRRPGRRTGSSRPRWARRRRAT